MSGPGVGFVRVILRLAVTCLVIFLFVFPSTAQTNDSDFLFLLASGFLCEPGDSSSCPATVKSNQGDSYEMSGAGTFDTQSKSTKIAGTYTHRSPNGNMLETGVWLAAELVEFSSYGPAPAALQRQNPVFGPQPLGLKHLPVPTSPMPTGGLVVLRVRLLPLRGPSRTAVLQVNCALGDVPRERSVEGIRLAFEGSTNAFTEEAGGRIMFLLARPEPSPPSKTQ